MENGIEASRQNSKQKKRLKRWYTLDNAAKIYPAVQNARWSSVYRISVTLKEEVDPVTLQEALEVTLNRFRNFGLRLRAGMFWYYLEENDKRPRVQPDVRNPCVRMSKSENGNYMFRVRFYKRRIALEVFHVVCDGTGAMYFLKTLTAEYLKRKEKIIIPPGDGVFNCNQRPQKGEMEDAFKRYATFKALKTRVETPAYHRKGTVEPPQVMNIITGIIPVSALREKSKTYGVTLTEYLTAAMIYALNECQKREPRGRERAVKISVPANLRQFYPSRTLRNFSLWVSPGIEPKYGEYSFEEIIDEVHHFIKMNLKEKYLNAMMCKNLVSEMNPFLRATPLFLKKIALIIAYNLYGESRFSGTFSNMGLVSVPKEMEPHIERFDFILGRSKNHATDAAGVSFKGNLYLNFSSALAEHDYEREFFTLLVKQGIPVKVESNRR